MMDQRVKSDKYVKVPKEIHEISNKCLLQLVMKRETLQGKKTNERKKGRERGRERERERGGEKEKENLQRLEWNPLSLELKPAGNLYLSLYFRV